MALSTVLALALALTAPQPESFADAWKSVETSIRQGYYARNRRRNEMDRFLAEAAPMATAARTREEFDLVVDGMIARFGDSHFALHTEDDLGYYMFDGLVNGGRSAQAPWIGAWFRPVDPKNPNRGYEVRMVLEGQAAAQAGLRRGDVVTSADGQPFRPVAALRGKSTVELGIVRDGNRRAVRVPVTTARPLEEFLRATRESSRLIEHGGKRIGYVRLWTCANDGFRQALASAVLGPLSGADAYIVDLRDGFGGRPEGFLDPFFRPEVTMEMGIDGRFGGQKMGTQKPLAVLINEGTRSAKEVLAFMVRTSKRGTLVGTPTAGDVLGTTPTRLNAWAYLEIPRTELRVNGENLEGNPVRPDVTVRDSIDGQGRDAVIQRALEILTEKGG